MELVSPLSTRRRIPSARLGIFMTALIVLVAGIGFGKTKGAEWFVLKNAIRLKYPNVRRITTEQLAGWLNDPQLPKPLLLDVRTEQEFAISRLAGARRVDPAVTAESAAAGTPRDAAIVTYCSVGYRSSAVAQRLQAAGFTNVRNLEGSIFQWASEGRPLFDSRGDRATRVHPYNEWWGKLLDDAVRAEIGTPR